MVKVIQCLAFTRHIENTLNIDEETCERWTTYAKDWGVTNLDGTPLIVTPELVEDNWGGVGVKVSGHYGIRSLMKSCVRWQKRIVIWSCGVIIMIVLTGTKMMWMKDGQ